MSFEAQPHLMSLLSSRPEPDSRPDETVRQHHFKIRAADSSRQLDAASMLIEKMYATRGYETNPLTDDSTSNRFTLVAGNGSSAVGTLTIGFDSPAGLLVDELFLDEVSVLRGAGRRVCEFTKFAVDRGVGSRQALAALFHVAYVHAHRIRGCDDLLIEVNPRHVRYYEAMLGFTVLSPQRLNKRVNAPAVLMSLDLSYAQEQINKFGGKPERSANERSLYPYAFSVSDEASIFGKLQRDESNMALAAEMDRQHSVRRDDATTRFH